MSKKVEDENIGSLFADLLFAPFYALGCLFKLLIVCVIISISVGTYFEYTADKCDKCKVVVTKGEYCQYCGRKMNDSTTINHIWIWPWERKKN